MTRITFHAFFGFGALLFALLAVFIEPLRIFLLRRSAAYGLALPPVLQSAPVIIDHAQEIRYVGRRTTGVEHFQNIFYAEDTSGKNRFAPPVALLLKKGSVMDATQPGAWCPQGTGDVLPFTSRVTNISENCLSLRVARPGGTRPDAKLPVMVWIHGGGHALGSASDVLYEPDGLVRKAAADKSPLIFVAINYRLGFFGFATSKTLIKTRQTNVGLRDQRAAFEWVRDNIQVFGGDPKRVTAVGQSVGASDISLQLTSFEGKYGVPFQQAVMMSGGPGLNFNTMSNLVANNTAAIAEKVDCVKDGDSQNAATLECLRKVAVGTLTNLSVIASRAARPPFGEGFFYPTYDGDFISDRPSQMMRAGAFAKGVPVIASWVTNDGAWYAAPSTSTDEAVLATFGLWLTGLSKPTQAKLLELYPVEEFEFMVRPEYDGPISPQYYRAAQLNRDIWFTCPVLDFAWQYAKHGGVEPMEVRLYEHNATRFTPSFELMGVPMWRVAHLSDIPYVLNVQHLGGGADNSPAQLRLAAEISQRIARFVTTGTPGESPNDISAWPGAFATATNNELKSDFPFKLSVRLTGGPYSNTTVTVSKDTRDSGVSEAEKAVRWERLLERCEFINSDQMREEAGV